MKKSEKQEMERRVNVMLSCFKNDELTSFIVRRMESSIEEVEYELTVEQEEFDPDYENSTSFKKHVKTLEKEIKDRKAILKDLKKVFTRSSKLSW